VAYHIFEQGFATTRINRMVAGRGEALSPGRPVSQTDDAKRLLRAQLRLSSAHREMDNASQLAWRLGSKLYVAT
jgi:hypothetical protein